MIGVKYNPIYIPTSTYGAIVTLTTVGYGVLSPQTPLGKALASLVMIMGYGIIAVPTGIVTHDHDKGCKGLTQRGLHPLS